jgi:hypothetical protein
MKWNPENIVSGVAVATQHPTVAGQFNVPLMIATAPYWREHGELRRFYTFSLNDAYCVHAGEGGVGMTAEELANELTNGGYFPVPKIVTEHSSLSQQPENRLTLPMIAITSASA